MLAATCPTSAAEKSADDTKYDLRYKLKLGEVLEYAVQHRASVRATIDDSTQEAQTQTDSIKQWKIVDVLPNGNIEFSHVLKQVHCINKLPDHPPTEYDSTKDQTPPPGFEAMARTIGVALSVVQITPRGEIVSRKSKTTQADPQQEGMIILRLPDEPVAVDDTWDEPYDVTVDLAGGGTKAIHTRRHHRLDSVSAGVANIEVTYQVLSPVDPHIEVQLIQRLEDGTVEFDIRKGRVLGLKTEVDKRILGFAGPTSSMHYIVRREEKLLDNPPDVARRP